MRIAALLLFLAIASCDAVPIRDEMMGEPYQSGDSWCTPQFDGTTYCEPLEGEKEVR